MIRYYSSATAALLLGFCGGTLAGVDSEFKERPIERFAVYTGDGNYKQAYHWAFNEDGQGPPVTVFLNHGSGGEWYDEIENKYGPCGPDYLSADDDFDGSPWAGLCESDGQGTRLYLADFNEHHVEVAPLLEQFMLQKIVGSTRFAAWYWQDAFSQFDSPVRIFMVGRYNVVTDPAHLDNALYWLKVTDVDSVTRDTLPPYNFDGYGLDDIDGDLRPMHAAPDISAFDNMFLYKAVVEQFSGVSLQNLIIEGRSNGGTAMIALASDYHIWPQSMREFWERNLPAQPQPDPEVEVVAGLTLEAVMANPELAAAFNTMLGQYSELDLLTALDNGQALSLAADSQPLAGTAGEYLVGDEPQPGQGGPFDAATFQARLSDYLHGDFYSDARLVHSFYPGCRLDALMMQDLELAPGEVAPNGDTLGGYKVAIPLMMSFGDEDSLYTDYCDERAAQAGPQTDIAGVLLPSAVSDGTKAASGTLFSPARHGFDYKDVYKNQPGDSATSQARAAASRSAIEGVVNQAIIQLGLQGSYSLPNQLD